MTNKFKYKIQNLSTKKHSNLFRYYKLENYFTYI